MEDIDRNATIRAITRCRVCGSAQLENVLDLGPQALTGRFPGPDEPDPMIGPLGLALCRSDAGDSCGLLQLCHSYPPDQMYGPSYGYRSSNNATMVAHLRAKIANLVNLVRPAPGDRILDIGSNDGTLLKFYDGMGLSRIGVDPSSKRYANEYPADTRLIVDFFSADTVRRHVPDGEFKIITSIAMFYDLEDPLGFMRDIVRLLAADGVWEFEQHYLVSMIRRGAYDSICHEHISYYSLQQIKWMADRAGLKIIGISTNDINGGSISVIAARKEAPYPEAAALIAKFLHEETAMGLGTLAPYHEFARRVAAHRLKLRNFLEQARRDGKVVFGYGASTKGNVILQYCNLTARDLPHIVEKYSAKYGRLTPGTRISIISEEEACVHGPDYMLVLPWYFREEIIERERAYLQQGGALVFVLPDLEVVTSKNM